jgi:hypothetical protein
VISSSRNALIPSMIDSMMPGALFPTSMWEKPNASMFLSPQTSWFAREMTPPRNAIPALRDVGPDRGAGRMIRLVAH